ncbi:YadA-like family protein [Paraburkholderia megapolitana]|uniref:YadA family autotransporter adhesin n=1 Tax=Paraburkholderia megapolitana TaxID=420953 RepID=UPI0038BC4712
MSTITSAIASGAGGNGVVLSSLSTSLAPINAASTTATSRGESVGATLTGGVNASGAVITEGREHDNTVTQVVQASGCGVANGLDTTATGLCSSAGTIAGVNGAKGTTVADGATAYGSQSLAQDEDSTAIGFRATSQYAGSVAIGYQAQAIADPATAVGANSLASGNNSVALGAGAQATAQGAVALGANSIADQANTVSVGSPGNERRITNVAPGINPTDAVNVSQLQGVQGNINDVARRAYSGVAAATALAMIPEVDPGKTLSVGFGSGNYQGYSAVAFGFTARIAENIKVKGGVSGGSAGTAFGVGAAYQW